MDVFREWDRNILGKLSDFFYVMVLFFGVWLMYFDVNFNFLDNVVS